MSNQTKFKTEVFCTLQVEGMHRWSTCPHDEVAYLRDDHRHVFYIKAWKNVTHNDRDVEFIMLKHRIQNYLYNKYFAHGAGPETNRRVHEFGDKSCEMIAQELIDKFELTGCEVSEDNENGAIVTISSDGCCGGNCGCK